MIEHLIKSLAPLPGNPFKHARAEIRLQVRAVRGLIALDELLGEAGDIEELCRGKRTELDGLQRVCADLEAKLAELADVEPRLAEARRVHGEVEQLCQAEQARLDRLRAEVSALEARKIELADIENKLADARALHAKFLSEVGVSRDASSA